jgi:uncharacterized protein
MNAQPGLLNPGSRLAGAAVGAGLKPQHYAAIRATRPDVGFFELHAENYMSAGGPPLRWLAALGALYPLSVHGVGLSLGSAEPLDRDRLARLAGLVQFCQPALVSEHLAWSDFSGRVFPDLLPLPYDEANLRRVAEKIDATQFALGRTILIENPATYLRIADSPLSETQFLDELAARTGCGLLLDVNNVHVCAVNHGFDAKTYLDAFPMRRVGEIHLAGFAETRDARGRLLIDNHGGPVSDEVWALYAHALSLSGPCPTLIEWDNDIPDWVELFAETQKAAAFQAQAAPARGLSREHAASFAMDAPDWRESQQKFAAALDDPDLPPPPLFADCDTDARFAVYRNNSAVAALGALKEQFPTVLTLVGDEAFADLARAYARQIPPRSPVLAEYGGAFADFVASFLGRCGAQAQIPYLPDLARLDWARLASLRAKEAPPCPVSRLAQLDPARLADVRPIPHPSLALQASDWPILAIARADEAPVRDWRGETALLLRPESELICVACPPATAAFLRACLEGATLGRAAEAAAEADETFDFGQILVELTQLGAFADFLA